MDILEGVFKSVPLDYFFLGGIALVLALDAMRSGIGRAAALVVALTSALFFSSLLSDTVFIGATIETPILQIVAFVALVAVNYFFLRRMGLEYLSGGIGQPLQSALAGVATAAVCAVIWLSVPGLSDYWEFGNGVRALFSEQFRLLWLLGAFGALAFARG